MRTVAPKQFLTFVYTLIMKMKKYSAIWALIILAACNGNGKDVEVVDETVKPKPTPVILLLPNTHMIQVLIPRAWSFTMANYTKAPETMKLLL